MTTKHLFNSIMSAVLLTLFIPFHLYAQYNDGDIFQGIVNGSSYNDQIELDFKVLSVKDKTCQLGSGEGICVHEQFDGIIHIPEIILDFKVISIASKAFSGCKDLNTIWIPSSVTTIKGSAFENCSNLCWISVDDDNPVYKGGSFLYDKVSKTLIACTYDVTSFSYNYYNYYDIETIGEGAFAGRVNLKDVEIPSSIVTIEEDAFYDCTSLETITIHEPSKYFNGPYRPEKNIQSIGARAFYNCTALQTITSEIQEPFAVDETVFQDKNGNPLSATLVVPLFTKSLYQQAKGWNQLNIVEESLNDGDYFIAETIEGIEMGFNVISAEAKTCSVAAWGNGISKGVKGHVTIPEVVKGFTVTEITESAFYECDGLTGVTIPYTVTKIDGRPFDGCPSLSSIKIDSKNPIFDSRDDCNAIIETATNKLLFGCKATKIPTTVTSLGIAAFENISGLVEITIPNSVTNIGSGAFYECNDLTKLTIPSSVTSIGTADNEISDDYMSIVYGCSSLISLSVEEGNRYYDSRNNCNAIIETASNTLLSGCVNTVIPNTISSIGSGAFAGIKNLRTIDIPYSVVNIGDFAFEHAGLTKITIPNSVVNIGKDAFQRTQLTEIIIPNSVINIGRGAFSDCELLTTIFIPKSLAKIGDEAFYCYEGAISNIYSEIEEPFAINEYTFNKETYANCKLHVPYGTTSKYQAQAGWSKFEKIIEPQDGDVFKEITAEGIEMAFTIWSAKDKTCIVGTSSSDAAISNTTTGIVTIPETAKGYKVIGVGEYAFLACTGVTGISIPSSVISLLEYSFSGCSGLSEISLPSGLLWIGEKAFSGCSALTSITIPASVTGFGHEVFIGCTNLSDVYSEIIKPFDLYDDVFRDAIYYKDATLHVPEGTKALYKKASGWKDFRNIDSGILEDGDYYTIQTIEGCDLYCQVISWKDKTCRIGFENVHWGAIPVTDEYYKGGITIPSIAQGYTVIQIEQGAFTGEEGLDYVVIPNTVKTINDYAFPYCENLKEIVLPNGLISIGERAFEACKSLQTVVIPNSVNSIGKYAFANCMSLYSVTSLVNIPFKLDETVFVVENEDYDRDVMYGIAKLYVPMGRLSIYQQTTGWEKFQNIIERTMSNKLTYMLDGNVYKTYDVQPGEVVTPEPDPIREGYDFSGWEGVPVIMPDHDVVVTGYFTPGTGVADLREAEVQHLQIYTLSGQRLSTPHKGINIINGKKVLVK